jgi:5,10-methylenetetrahydromethanopterin reductase
VRFGLRLIPLAGGLDDLVSWAVAAEDAGFDQVWIPQDAFMENARALSVLIAARTSRIEIGAMSDPYSSDPAELASYAATLDLISGGRALIGVGLHTHETVSSTGNNPHESVARVRETVELVRTLLRGDVASATDGIFDWSKECYLRFQPLRPRIPIYVVPVGDDLLRLSGAIGDGSLPRLIPPTAASRVVPRILRGVENASRPTDSVDIAACVWLSLAEESSAAADTLRPMVSYFGPSLEPDILRDIGLAPDDFVPLRELVNQGKRDEAAALVTPEMLGLAIVGTPDQVKSQISLLQGAGVTQANIGGPLGPDPLEAIRLMGEEVIPYFRDDTAVP